MARTLTRRCTPLRTCDLVGGLATLDQEEQSDRLPRRGSTPERPRPLRMGVIAMNGAIVVRWGASVPGREAKGLEVFANGVAQFEGHLKSGRIHSHKEFLSVTGHDGGFMIV